MYVVSIAQGSTSVNLQLYNSDFQMHTRIWSGSFLCTYPMADNMLDAQLYDDKAKATKTEINLNVSACEYSNKLQ